MYHIHGKNDLKYVPFFEGCVVVLVFQFLVPSGSPLPPFHLFFIHAGNNGTYISKQGLHWDLLFSSGRSSNRH